jgi:hypothetical protein
MLSLNFSVTKVLHAELVLHLFILPHLISARLSAKDIKIKRKLVD